MSDGCAKSYDNDVLCHRCVLIGADSKWGSISHAFPCRCNPLPGPNIELNKLGIIALLATELLLGDGLFVSFEFRMGPYRLRHKSSNAVGLYMCRSSTTAKEGPEMTSKGPAGDSTGRMGYEQRLRGEFMMHCIGLGDGAEGYHVDLAWTG